MYTYILASLTAWLRVGLHLRHGSARGNSQAWANSEYIQDLKSPAALMLHPGVDSDKQYDAKIANPIEGPGPKEFDTGRLSNSPPSQYSEAVQIEFCIGCCPKYSSIEVFAKLT